MILGANWALDNGYTGSVNTGLRSISMYSADIGVVGAVRGGTVYTRFPGTNFPPFDCEGIDFYLPTILFYFIAVSTIFPASEPLEN